MKRRRCACTVVVTGCQGERRENIGARLVRASGAAAITVSLPHRHDRHHDDECADADRGGTSQSLGSTEMSNSTTTIADWVQLVRAEYLEIPGLHLTERQVQRLWGLDPATCASLLDALVHDGFLRRTRQARYVRSEAYSHSKVRR